MHLNQRCRKFHEMHNPLFFFSFFFKFLSQGGGWGALSHSHFVLFMGKVFDMNLFQLEYYMSVRHKRADIMMFTIAQLMWMIRWNNGATFSRWIVTALSMLSAQLKNIVQDLPYILMSLRYILSWFNPSIPLVPNTTFFSSTSCEENK